MMNWNWPDNKRIALLLSFDIDAETLWLTRNDINERHLVHMSRGLYATKQGLPRILKMLEEEGLKATFFHYCLYCGDSSGNHSIHCSAGT